MTALKLGLSNEVEYFMASGLDNDCAVAPTVPAELRTGLPFEDICNGGFINKKQY